MYHERKLGNVFVTSHPSSSIKRAAGTERLTALIERNDSHSIS